MSSDVIPLFCKKEGKANRTYGSPRQTKNPDSWENSAEEISIVKVFGRILES
jgi:hypothetical protein